MNKKRFYSAVKIIALSALICASCDNDSNDGGGEPQDYGPKVSGISLILDDGYSWEGGITPADYWTMVRGGGQGSGLGILYEFSGNYFTGTVVGQLAGDLSLLSCEYGFIVLQVDDGGNMSVPLTRDKYYVVRWKNLRTPSNMVNISMAFRTGSANNGGMDTAEAAIKEFTDANGYFDKYPDYSIRSH